MGMILCLLNISAIRFTAWTVPGGVEGDGLIVGFHQFPAVAPDHIHDVVIGIRGQAEAHAEAGELGRLLQLLAHLDELVPGLGGIDLGGLEDIQAGDQGPGLTACGTP